MTAERSADDLEARCCTSALMIRQAPKLAIARAAQKYRDGNLRVMAQLSKPTIRGALFPIKVALPAEV
jgi:hypothetical protein